MNSVRIENKISPKLRVFMLVVGAYNVLLGFYGCVNLAMDGPLNFLFYMNLILIILGIILILMFTIWQSKPLICVDIEKITFNLPEQKPISPIEWQDITEVGIGIGSLKIITIGQKSTDIDLSALKYKDIRELKSIIVECCELKNIPYKNA
ncbi:hypothetical protein M2132_002389 [Dysgonomonas sp. PH5-45]|uniref:hypothetical protein n=1 Tax=unclassified Dysgonomonas TaxID=2630389 RepID=UPI002474F741|nr:MULTISPECIES: hypothetical protein [unclassified Dysgonomonas]MDH6356035.1 hypothetical protein [Dysgonomonas sp. PH5-45]MDH6388924.1 hypothetical protein [Dysgonomonas sp. PH5-37]